MNEIRIAVIFDQPVRAGGGHHQAISAALAALNQEGQGVRMEFFTTVEEALFVLKNYGITAKLISIKIVDRILFGMDPTSFVWRFLRRVGIRRGSGFENELVKEGIDLVYFLTPTNLAKYLDRLNYISTVWDLCHRDHPEFPEVRNKGEFYNREMLLRSTLPRAVAVLVDSSSTGAKLERFYGVDKSRIHVMPFDVPKTFKLNAHRKFSGTPDVIKESYNISNDFIFYPAQFWAHKNHAYILNGLSILEKKFQCKYDVVFCGSDKGNAKHIIDLGNRLGLGSRVKFLGFLTDEMVRNFYRASVALVMPTYFGPTNLPPLEAFSLGIPVLYPRLPGSMEQLGDAPMEIDLADPETMAIQLIRLRDDPILRAKKIQSGYDVLARHDEPKKDAILASVIREFRVKRACWG